MARRELARLDPREDRGRGLRRAFLCLRKEKAPVRGDGGCYERVKLRSAVHQIGQLPLTT